MSETTVTLVGNVATNVEYRDTATGGVARFRFAVSARRWDRERAVWTDGPTSFYTVSAWRALAVNLAASVSVGEPLVVHGRLKIREEELDGRRKTFVDVAATAVGHDLTRGTAAFRRAVRAVREMREVREAREAPASAPPPAGEGEWEDRDGRSGVVRPIGVPGKALDGASDDVSDPWRAGEDPPVVSAS
ncbi:single-stranded DNA-binding protein [Streptomyces sp. NPDC046203]|uniref:single-stranded DNA-binding protein n=1 Tax=Streptomyces sp. NPDC046203 TaxID=3154602 RepID=UPI0033ED12FE